MTRSFMLNYVEHACQCREYSGLRFCILPGTLRLTSKKTPECEMIGRRRSVTYMLIETPSGEGPDKSFLKLRYDSPSGMMNQRHDDITMILLITEIKPYLVS